MASFTPLLIIIDLMNDQPMFGLFLAVSGHEPFFVLCMYYATDRNRIPKNDKIVFGIFLADDMVK